MTFNFYEASGREEKKQTKLKNSLELLVDVIYMLYACYTIDTGPS